MQALKVLLLRWYYRLASWIAWRKTDLSAVEVEALLIPADWSGVSASISGRIYRPCSNHDANHDANKLVVYFHGGGWVIGDLQTHDPFCRTLALQSGATVIAINYRLAPAHPYPAAAQDCLAATRWLLDNKVELRLENAKLIVAGDSAGGNLAAITSNQLTEDAAGEIAGQLLIYPAVRHYHPVNASYVENATGSVLTRKLMEWFWDTYLDTASGDQASDGPVKILPLATPLHDELTARLPAALIITAGLDPLRDEGAEYAAKLEAAGVDCQHQLFDTQMHGFVCSQGPTPAHLRAMSLIVKWMEEL